MFVYEYFIKTHWSRVTHICVSKLTTIGSDNGLSPGRRQAIIWTNAGIIPALVQIMAWRRPGDKPLSEAMMVNLLTHICVSRPQWVKTVWLSLINMNYQWDAGQRIGSNTKENHHLFWYGQIFSSVQREHFPVARNINRFWGNHHSSIKSTI